MSQELKRGGTIVGSAAYFFELNNRSGLTKFLATPKAYAYDEIITELGKKAERTVETIYEDYRKYAQYLRYFPERERKQVIDLANGLCALAEMSGNRVSKQNDLMYLLALNASDTRANSSASGREISDPAESLARGRYVSTSRGMELAKLASERDFIEVKNETEAKMMDLLFDGKSKEVIKDILWCAQYQIEHKNYTGKCGYELGSERYIEWAEKQVFGMSMHSRVGDKYQYAAYIKKLLGTTRDWIREDLEQGARNSDYITDESADLLKRAIRNLEKCKIDCYNLTEKVEKLAWFVGGNPSNIKKLQIALREFDIGTNVEIDGVYGPVTHGVCSEFIERLEQAAIAKLFYVGAERDFLEIGEKGLEVASEASQKVNIEKIKPPRRSRNTVTEGGMPWFVVAEYEKRNKQRMRTFSTGVPIDKHSVLGKLQKASYDRINNVDISRESLEFLKKFSGKSKFFKIGGKVLAVTGTALDVLTLYNAVQADLNDQDKKLGKTSVKTAAEIGAGTVASAVLGKYGASAGAAIGSMILPGVGTVIGGIIGGFVVGYLAGEAGEALAEYVVDITMLE